MDDKRIINISGLSKGVIAKNYNDMCRLLGCKPCKGHGSDRDCQIKNWQRYFNFEKSGHKFIVTEIYDTPLPVLDGRKTKEGKYNKYIELLLIKYLLTRKENHSDITKRELYSVLGMVNQNYGMLNYDDNYKGLQKELGKMTIFNLRQFHQRVENKLSKMLFTALESMMKRHIITYEKKFIINVSKDGSSSNYESIVALPYQESIILETQQDILDEFGYKNISQVALKYKVREFYSRVNEQLNEKYGWLEYYTQISISLLKDYDKAQCLTAEEIRGLSSNVQREQFNIIVLREVKQQSYTKYEKYQEQSIESFLDGSVKFRYDEEYLEEQSKLADFLIDINVGDKYQDFWLDIDNKVLTNKNKGDII